MYNVSLDIGYGWLVVKWINELIMKILDEYFKKFGIVVVCIDFIVFFWWVVLVNFIWNIC